MGAGEDATLTFTAVDAVGAPINLTGYKLYFIVKVRIEDKDWVFFKRSLNAGGSDAEAVLLDQTTAKGKYSVFIKAAESIQKKPSFEAPYQYGTWVVSGAGALVRVVKRADFNLTSVVTNF